jgi:acyl-homoserine lactone acylase PvdQ
VIGAGHNGRIAWGITSGASDVDDVYAEKLVPGDPESYVFRGKAAKMRLPATRRSRTTAHPRR